MRKIYSRPLLRVIKMQGRPLMQMGSVSGGVNKNSWVVEDEEDMDNNNSRRFYNDNDDDED